VFAGFLRRRSKAFASGPPRRFVPKVVRQTTAPARASSAKPAVSTKRATNEAAPPRNSTANAKPSPSSQCAKGSSPASKRPGPTL
jgi:hypothetical protein